MANIFIDTLVPTAVAHVVDERDAVTLQHNDVCTRISFDKVEAMSLDEYRRDVLSKQQPDDGTLYVVRNPVEGEFSFIMGEQVLRYNIQNMEEVPLKDLVRKLVSGAQGAQIAFVPNMPYPLVYYRRSEDGVEVCYRVASERRVFQFSPKDNRSLKFSCPYYPPNLWIRLQLSLTGALTQLNVAVEPQAWHEIKQTRLWQWPLTNAWPTGRVCLGDKVLEDQGMRDDAHLGDVVYRSTLLFFGGWHNFDLFQSWSYALELGLPRNAPIAEPVRKATMEHGITPSGDNMYGALGALLKAMEKPNGWRNLKWENTTRQISVRSFTNEVFA